MRLQLFLDKHRVLDDFEDGDFDNHPSWSVLSGAWDISDGSEGSCQPGSAVHTSVHNSVLQIPFIQSRGVRAVVGRR